LGGRKGIRPVKKLERCGAGVVICLERGAELHMAQLMSLPLTLASVKSRLVLAFWYRLTRVVPEKGPLNGCVCALGVLLLLLRAFIYRKFARATNAVGKGVEIVLYCVMIVFDNLYSPDQ